MLELLASVCYIATFLVILPAIFWGERANGGGFSTGIAFAWHPVLMALAYPCLMSLGRIAFVLRAKLGIKTRRAIHGTLMMLGIIIAVAGYMAIFKAHWNGKNGKRFFGYNFKLHKWNDQWAKLAHIYLGYIVLIASVVQAGIGPMKIIASISGKRMFRWHGKLGKAIMIGAMINFLLAIYFWKWQIWLKVILGILFTAAGLLGALLPREPVHPEVKSDADAPGLEVSFVQM